MDKNKIKIRKKSICRGKKKEEEKREEERKGRKREERKKKEKKKGEGRSSWSGNQNGSLVNRQEK